ncbi:unnamed protein product [Blepharisma stoltei]|uniref:Calcium-dependent protein kinase 1 n=1 Tax=Blepharisma stoltei TaxID=1481888 RepID=A0AAU9JHW2_9CILI|nr:unnamed protein product [Blepharisma stoltei]
MEFSISQQDFVFEREGLLRDIYKIGNKIGEGAFSSVRRIKHRETLEKRAVKTVHKKKLRNESERQMIFNEVSILSKLDHPNILKIYEFYQDEKNYYIITEFCSGGELFEKIIRDGNLSEGLAASYMRQLLAVLVYLHDRHVVHRDIKPENLVLSSSEPDSILKVIDFGTAQAYTPGEKMHTRFGTPYYIAPEVLAQRYDEKCDMWSAGVNMYILLSGMPPFGGNSDHEILNKVKTGRYSFPSPEWDSISFEAKDLIEKMLTFDPERRISAREALAHPWLLNAARFRIDQAAARTALGNLKNFRTGQKLKKATLAYIASQLATKTEREEMVKLFESLDTDENGTVSRDELRHGFELIFATEFEDIDEEINRIMNEVDINRSGEIDYNEFVTACLNRQNLVSRKRLEAAFKAFDLDGSGTITADELKEILGKYHKHDDQFWRDMIREADLNGDGVIDLQEFVKMMLENNQVRF